MRALVCQTQDLCPGGTIADALADSGIELTVWRTDTDPSPSGLDGFDAVVALGGAANPDDDLRYAWLERERQLLREALRRRVPTLGLCLGAQLLAQVGGGTVRRIDPPHIGWLDVTASVAGRRDPLYATLPPRHRVFEWHSYGFTLPRGAELLAGSPAAVQAFRLAGRAWGLQYHLEASEEIVRSWIDHYEDELRITGPEPEALTCETTERAATQARYARDFGVAFAQLVTAGAVGLAKGSAAL